VEGFRELFTGNDGAHNFGVAEDHGGGVGAPVDILLSRHLCYEVVDSCVLCELSIDAVDAGDVEVSGGTLIPGVESIGEPIVPDESDARGFVEVLFEELIKLTSVPHADRMELGLFCCDFVGCSVGEMSRLLSLDLKGLRRFWVTMVAKDHHIGTISNVDLDGAFGGSELHTDGARILRPLSSKDSHLFDLILHAVTERRDVSIDDVHGGLKSPEVP